MRDVYFPPSAVASLVTRLEDGGMIEAVMVGRDGVVNGTSALDGKASLDECVLQVAGTSFEISPYIALRNELLVAFECSRYHTDWQPKNGVAT